MRSLLLACSIALMLSGCASTSPPASADEPILDDVTETLQTVRIDVSAGTGLWHDAANQPLDGYNLATQPVAHPCVWNGQEIYFNNMALGSSGYRDPIANGTDTLIVTLSWTEADSLLPSLVLGYWPAGHDGPYETQHIMNGQETNLDVRASSEGGWWSFWACVSNENDDPFIDDRGPRSFWGELTWDIDAMVSVPGNATA